MLNWLRAIGEAQELRVRLAVSEQRTKDVEARLFAEIAANRQREDGLVELLTTGRGVLSARSTPRPLSEPDEREDTNIDPDFEDLIEKRAKEFQQLDIARGVEIDLDLYKAAIKMDPDAYLSN